MVGGNVEKVDKHALMGLGQEAAKSLWNIQTKDASFVSNRILYIANVIRLSVNKAFKTSAWLFSLWD